VREVEAILLRLARNLPRGHWVTIRRSMRAGCGRGRRSAAL